ncbi:MAG: hypothetical protein JWM09_70 [Francisellaceae bacterium]|nr:hypothetical protein [Francisellaceae bacterium]
MSINLKNTLLISLLLYSVSGFSAAHKAKPYDSPVVKYIDKKNPIVTIYEEEAGGDQTWFLKDYDHQFIILKAHDISEGKEYWTFQIKPEAFISPHILKVNLLLGDPESLYDFEEHHFLLITKRKS